MASRKRRYLGCLGVLVAVTALLALANFALSRYYRHQSDLIARDMAKRGYPATFDELVARQNTTPNGQRNGAIEILEAIAQFNDEGVNYEFIPMMEEYELPPPGTPIPPEAMTAMKQILDQNAGMLESISRGLSRDVFRLPADVNSFDDLVDLFPEDMGKHTRNAARLICVRAIYAGESGDLDTAIRSISEILQLAGCYTNQPSLHSYLVGQAVLGIGYQASTTFIERGYLVSSGAFAKLEDAIASAHNGDLIHAYWGEVLTWEWYLDVSMPGTNEILLEIRDEPVMAFGLFGFVFDYLRMKSFLGEAERRDGRRMVASFGEALSKTPRAREERHDDASSARAIVYPTLAVNPPPLRFYPLMRARQQCALLAVRVARFANEKGQMPNSEEFAVLAKGAIDPFDDQTMRFQITESGFAVYSVGPNGHDDGGMTRHNQAGADDAVVEIRLAH